MLHIKHPLRGDAYCGHPDVPFADDPEDADCPECQDAYQHQGDIANLAGHHKTDKEKWEDRMVAKAEEELEQPKSIPHSDR